MFHDKRAPWRQESEIVWLEPGYYPYLREDVVMRGRRASEISGDKIYGKLVAYAKLKSDAPNNGMRGCFDRRIWYLKPHDTPSGWPLEAVEPLSITVGKPSRRGLFKRPVDWCAAAASKTEMHSA